MSSPWEVGTERERERERERKERTEQSKAEVKERLCWKGLDLSHSASGSAKQDAFLRPAGGISSLLDAVTRMTNIYD